MVRCLLVSKDNPIQEKTFRTPCFLLNFVSIKKLEINDSDYWSIVYETNEQIQRLKQMLCRDGLFLCSEIFNITSLTLKENSSTLVQLLSSNESSLRTWFHALQLFLVFNLL